MSFAKYLIYFLLIIPIVSSCEDTKSKKTEQQNSITKSVKKEQAKKDDSIVNSIKIPAGGTKTEVNLREIEFVEQEELIPFLEKYGENNPENLVLISTSFGDIKVRLFNDTPLHRANFIRLVKMGYFNTTFFHRVAKDFVIQGGNSDRVATTKVRNRVGSFLIPSEFSNQHKHNRGAFSAAKYAEQNVSKASSPFEFFIVQSQRGAHHLDNDHTVGEVISGMDVVDKIAQVEVDDKEWPRENVEMKIKILD
ncbi:peptidylprolyl isomerase [Mesonia maritima]|uniref:peptidylprolyl isomerase n=1 Tax=Mesonia maritima TaxID=1793873 RepID=UPI00362E5814